MARPHFESVDDYLASLPDATQEILQRVRSVIRKAVPDAEEVISYQIPTYKLNGRAAIYFAGFKEHFSLYPATRTLVEAFPDELAGRVVSKGTIRFSLSEPVPVKLIERIAKFRAKETLASQQAKKQQKPVAKAAAQPKAKGAAKKR